MWARPTVALIAVLVVALLARLVNIHIVEFRYDQAQLLAVAQSAVMGEALELISANSSVGVPGPTGASYALLPPLLLSSEPLAVNIYLVILHTAAAGAVWWCGRRLGGDGAGLIAGLSYACHPWAIHFARFIWAPNVQLAFIPPLLMLLILGALDRRRWAQIGFFVWLALTLFVTVYAWALLPAFAWLLWTTRRAWGWRLPAGVVLVVLALTPFMIAFGLWATNRPARPLPSARTLRFEPVALERTLYLLTGLNVEAEYSTLPTEANTAIVDPLLPTWAGVVWLLGAALVGIGIVVVIRDRRHRPIGIMLTVALFTPTAIFLPGVLPNYMHYFAIVIPIAAILTGIGAAALLKGRRPLAVSVGVGLIAVWAMQLWIFHSAVARYDRIQIGLGLPLHYQLSTRAALLDARDIVIVGGETGSTGYDIWKTLLYPQSYDALCLREIVIADGGIVVLPAHPFSVLRAPGAADPLLDALYIRPDAETFPLRPTEGAYTVTRFDTAPATPDLPARMAIMPASFSNGATLIGYAFADGRLYSEWRLDRAHGENAQVFAHLLDAAGERVGQRDSVFYPGKYWCGDDRVITWVDLALPETARTLRIGMYPSPGAPPDAIDVIMPDGARAPWVDLTLIAPP